MNTVTGANNPGVRGGAALNVDYTASPILGLPGRADHGHTLFGSDRGNRLDSIAFTADSERVVLGGCAYASDDGSWYGSVMRVRLHAQDLLKDGFE